MAIDYAEKEREFLESLGEDTGRDLEGWMAAITAANPGDRNAIIDWLRTQGFLFAKASWLERIHHNGGRPIYLDAPVLKAMPVTPAAGQKPPASEPAALAPPPPRADLDPTPADAPAPRDVSAGQPSAAPSSSARDTDQGAALENLLAEAKAYRPLATFVLKEIEKTVPGIRFVAQPGYVEVHHAGPVGALTIAPRELRLALAFGAHPAPDPFVKARFAKTHPGMPGTLTHMVVLNDARQITPALLAAVRAVALQPSS